MARELQSIDIKGKNYVLVNERVKAFRETFPGWSMESEIVELDKEWCVIKAVIRDNDGIVKATGLAYELANSTYINKTSYVENCETSAWGRALGNLGIGVDTSMCTADELVNALINQRIGTASNTDKPQEPEYEVKFITDVQRKNIEDFMKSEPALIAGLLNGRNLSDLTNEDFGHMMNAVSEYRRQMSRLPKAIEYYAKSRGITADAARTELKTAYGKDFNVNTISSADEISKLLHEIKEMADSAAEFAKKGNDNG